MTDKDDDRENARNKGRADGHKGTKSNRPRGGTILDSSERVAQLDRQRAAYDAGHAEASKDD